MIIVLIIRSAGNAPPPQLGTADADGNAASSARGTRRLAAAPTRRGGDEAIDDDATAPRHGGTRLAVKRTLTLGAAATTSGELGTGRLLSTSWGRRGMVWRGLLARNAPPRHGRKMTAAMMMMTIMMDGGRRRRGRGRAREMQTECIFAAPAGVERTITRTLGPQAQALQSFSFSVPILGVGLRGIWGEKLVTDGVREPLRCRWRSTFHEPMMEGNRGRTAREAAEIEFGRAGVCAAAHRAFSNVGAGGGARCIILTPALCQGRKLFGGLHVERRSGGRQPFYQSSANICGGFRRRGPATSPPQSTRDPQCIGAASSAPVHP